jgi:hypothetical protein
MDCPLLAQSGLTAADCNSAIVVNYTIDVWPLQLTVILSGWPGTSAGMMISSIRQ